MEDIVYFIKLGFQTLDNKHMGKLIRPMGSKNMIEKTLTELAIPAQLHLTPASPTSSSPWQPGYWRTDSDSGSISSVSLFYNSIIPPSNEVKGVTTGVSRRSVKLYCVSNSSYNF